VDRIEVSTVVYLPPEPIYDFLVDFPRYATLSEHLREVRQFGDGDPGTQYHLSFAWWKLSYTAHSEVTGVEPPTRIDWKLIKDLDARGHWRIDPDEPVPEDREAASRVYLVIRFDPHSADDDAIDLPRFVSLSWVIEKVKPLVQGEAEAIVEKLVADLEGTRREVELDIHAAPESV
jgi:uncharacterized membrane protein